MMYGIIDILKWYQLDVKVEKSDNIIILKVNDDGSVIKTDLLNPVESNNKSSLKNYFPFFKKEG